MKKLLGILLVAVMGFAMVLPAFAEVDQTIYLKGSGSNFTANWNNMFTVAGNVGQDPNVWHIVYSGNNVDAITAMQLDFGENGIWKWDTDMGFSTNNGGNNPGWVVIAPADWEIDYVNVGNNKNVSNSFVVTSEEGNIQFNISGFHKGTLNGIAPKGELKLKKFVDGELIGDWWGSLDESKIAELADLITFDVYAVNFDGDDDLTNSVGMGFLETDGSITFQSDEDGTNKFAPGWYAIVEKLEGKAADIFINDEGQVGPLYVYLGVGGVMSAISEENVAGIFKIGYTSGYSWGVKLAYEDGTVFDGGTKPDGSNQQLTTERFDTLLPDGNTTMSFCADLGAHNVWGEYIFDEENHGFGDNDMKHLIAALDFINDVYSLDKNPGKAVAQIIVWNMILKVDGNAGYADNWAGGNTYVTSIEGGSGWYEPYKGIVDDILNDAQKYVEIYDAKINGGGSCVSGVVFIKGNGIGDYGENLIPSDQQRQIVVLFGNGTVFNNETIVKGKISFTKTKVGGIYNEVAKKCEFFFDLYQFADGAWVMVNDVDKPYATGWHGKVRASDLLPGLYKFVERPDEVWTIEQQFAYGATFTIGVTGDAVWQGTEGDALLVVNVPVLGPSYGSVTATNENNRAAIIAGLNPKNGNPFYGDNKNPDTPFVVPNSNHFVYAVLDRADLANGVVLDMMVGNNFDVVGKAMVKLVGNNLEITFNGEGSFGAIAFNELPVFKNGNIHSQKADDLMKAGALTGFNHDNKTIIPCPERDTIFLYIHCDPIQFYNALLAWK